MSYDKIGLGNWSGMDSDTAQYLMYKKAEVEKKKIEAINKEKMKALEIERNREQHKYNLEKDRIINESERIRNNHDEVMEKIKSKRIDDEQKRDNERLEILLIVFLNEKKNFIDHGLLARPLWLGGRVAFWGHGLSFDGFAPDFLIGRLSATNGRPDFSAQWNGVGRTRSRKSAGGSFCRNSSADY